MMALRENAYNIVLHEGVDGPKFIIIVRGNTRRGSSAVLVIINEYRVRVLCNKKKKKKTGYLIITILLK